ncbi:MAG: DUF3307 domain-containing protein [Anaerolineae bacterium]|nr:DUF3307 domain-containing protein [Anaerolineae bacterium]
MLVPHLMFAHMMADYVLQTNWLVARKGKTLYGLLLHGGIVGVMSLLALSPYLGDVWLLLIGLTAIHTFQDYLKVRYGPRLAVHPFIPYIGDQFGHYITIGVLQLIATRAFDINPSHAEIVYMWTGAAVIAVTRFYDVTWWANWLDMIPYFNRWRVFGYVERICMLALSAAGAWYIAPLVALPRLIDSQRQNRPIWKERRGMLEVVIGVIFSITLGLLLGRAYGTL